MEGSALRAAVVALGLVLAGLEGRAGEHTYRGDPLYLIDTWETDHGLPENSATAIVQSREGYLWFGTFGGLVRFDGHSFSVFHPGNTPELPSAGIVNLHYDRHDRLWVSTFTGVARMEGDHWTRIGRDDGWVGEYARTISERPNGDLLFTTFGGEVLQYVDGRFEELPAPPGEPRQGYFGMVDEQGAWWVAQNRFIGRWDGTTWVELLPASGLSRVEVAGATARDGGIWLLAGEELLKYRDGEVDSRVRLPRKPGSVWSLSEDRAGNIWICTQVSGVCRVAPDGGLLQWSVTNGLSHHSTRCAFEDREGNVWVAVNGGGLVRFKPRRAHEFSREAGLTERLVHAVWPDGNGGLWVGSYGDGVFRWIDGRMARVPFEDGSGSTYVQSIVEDKSGRLWVGTYNQDLWRVAGNEVTRFEDAVTGARNHLALFSDSRDRLWIGSGARTVLVDHDHFISFSDQSAPENVCFFAEDRDGVIWLTNGRGVFCHDGARFQEVLVGGRESIRDIVCLRTTEDGAVWMGSRNEGLLRWRAGGIARIGTSEGLRVDAVHGILEDHRGYFWMPSHRGIMRARRSDLEAIADGRGSGDLTCQLLDAGDGLPSVECVSGRQPACAIDTQGRLWFATSKGVGMIDPDRFAINANAPAVRIESVVYHAPPRATGRDTRAAPHLDGRAVRLSAPFRGPVRLPAGSRQIEIHYAALTFTSPEDVRFQTRLGGIAGAWEDAGTRRFDRFHELPPGEHVFEVRAGNEDDVWNLAGTALGFAVQPFFWQTLWFRGALALALFGLGGGTAWWLSMLRIRAASERERVARALEESHQTARELSGRLIHAQEDERRRLARELHDDLNQRLSLLAVELEQLAGAPCHSGADHAGTRLASMAQDVKAISSEVHKLAYQLHPAKLDQLGLAFAAKSLLRDFTRHTGILIHASLDDVPSRLDPEAALCLYRVLQESLQNVARHSGAREASVELRRERDWLFLAIEDAGRGFGLERARQEGGLGLLSMRERVRLAGGSFALRSAFEKGTRIDVRIPIKGGGQGCQS